MRTLDFGRLTDGLREQTGAFAETVRGADPGLRVPTCPEWLLRDLVGHIGQAHRWAADRVRAGEAAPVPDPLEADSGDPARWPEWLRAGADELVDAVRQAGAATGAATTVWTFLGPLPAAFWLRRMLHETSVHLVDAALTTHTAFAIAPDLAADAITEGLELLSAPGMTALKPGLVKLRGRGEKILLLPRETDQPGWLVTRTPGGPVWERGTTGGDVVVSGQVSDLLLIFTRRLAVGDGRIGITGDHALLDHWLANTAV
ncbi:maleylpyruvate isomerase family mycothiol-dependent enzyme [Amycolatopsis nigrescens]|uniref:maleylpyruvate isomerase family mycothiol-dependent enzyme n=1 Tax=Amycolatopsis nigrescens TaxID=381445 RepID=UPI000365991F|nr:maleylpyruvate isomerase family mycothiol-dependent enzyme [Amycolatopsis nigrescens]